MSRDLRSVVRGVGAYLPERVVTNDDLARIVDTSDAWIRQRTGIAQRHFAAPGQTTSDLGARAASAALARAGLDAKAIDLIVVATSTPDHTFPATAAAIQRQLGCGPCPAFDVQAVCAGFVFALATADAMLRAGQARRALVIGAETFSRLVDWNDRATCVLFGDGAGAMILEAQEAGERGVLATRIRTDGAHYERLQVDGGASSTGTIGKLRMDGKEVFKHAVKMMSEITVETLAAADLAVDDLDWLAPHQANVRIIDKVGERLAVDPAKVARCVERHANTSAASIPLALDHLERQGALRAGAAIGLVGMGGGFSWGAAAIRW